MAKLNGVKTLDMVNGEITKVAYEGAEYAKVDGLVKSTEDILLAIENGLDRTKGEFYRVISVGSTVRWEDNTSANGVGAEYISDRFEVFRKATPAEVEKYEQALMELEKAHKDVEIAEKWAKIGRNVGELRKGDIVHITDTCGAPLRDGELIEVISNSIEMSALVKGGWAVCSKLIAPVESLF